jgi:hypothetical protein
VFSSFLSGFDAAPWREGCIGARKKYPGAACNLSAGRRHPRL